MISASYHNTLKPVCFDSKSGSVTADGVATGLLVITYTLPDFCVMSKSTELLEDNSQIRIMKDGERNHSMGSLMYGTPPQSKFLMEIV